MADNKKLKGKQDDIRIDLNDAGELAYFHRQYSNLTRAQLKAAIKKAGPYREKLIRYLKKKFE